MIQYICNDEGYEAALYENGACFVRDPKARAEDADRYEVTEEEICEDFGWNYWPEHGWVSPEEFECMIADAEAEAETAEMQN